MDTLLQDIRYGLRTIVKAPAFAVIATLTLALGIGANTALFSVVNGVLLNPLPYAQPNRLVAVYTRSKEFKRSSISYPNFLDWVRDQPSFTGMAAFRSDDFTLTGQGEPERLKAEMVSADFFPLLGVKPVIGRLFRVGRGCRRRPTRGPDQRRAVGAEVRLGAQRAGQDARPQWHRLYGRGRDPRRLPVPERQLPRVL